MFYTQQSVVKVQKAKQNKQQQGEEAKKKRRKKTHDKVEKAFQKERSTAYEAMEIYEHNKHGMAFIIYGMVNGVNIISENIHFSLGVSAHAI